MLPNSSSSSTSHLPSLTNTSDSRSTFINEAIPHASATQDLTSTAHIQHDQEQSDEELDEFADMDHPVQVEQYERNVRVCKTIIAAGVVLGIGCDVYSIVRSNGEKVQVLGSKVASLSIKIITLVLLGSTLHSFPSISLSKPSPLERFTPSQRSLCFLLFSLANIDLILISAQTYLLIDIFSYINHGIISLHLYNLYGIKLLLGISTFFASGCMRRGPKLWYHAPSTELGFGMQATKGIDTRQTMEILRDEKVGEPKPNVFDYTQESCLKLLFFGSLWPLLTIVVSGQPISETDMPYQNQASRAFAILGSSPSDRWAAFKQQYEKKGKGTEYIVLRDKEEKEVWTRWRVFRAIWDGLWGTIAYNAAVVLFNRGFLIFVPTICLHQLVGLYETGDIWNSQHYALLLAVLFMAATVVYHLLAAWDLIRMNYLMHEAAKVRGHTLVFEKVLRMPDSTLISRFGEARLGPAREKQMLQLITRDVENVAQIWINSLFGCMNDTLVWALGLAILTQMLGWSVAGFGFMFLGFIPLWILGERNFRQSVSLASAKDHRVRQVRSTLQMLKVLKLNAWDRIMAKRISDARRVELDLANDVGNTGTYMGAATSLSRGVAIICVLFFHVSVRKRELQAADAFATITCFLVIGYRAMKWPERISAIQNQLVGLDRLASFLNEEELELPQRPGQGIALEGVTAGFHTSSEDDQVPAFELSDISIKVSPDTFTVVAGTNGSGKTLLLLTLMGEAKLSRGSIQGLVAANDVIPGPQKDFRSSLATDGMKMSWIIPGAIAYGSQQAQIIHGNIKGNITFGQPMWSERYKATLAACALDLDDFPDGDATEIGEGESHRGYTISGGQRHRIQLARCIYSRAGILLLDDPLSAVDVDTANHLVRECFQGQLVRSRSVVITTNHVDLLEPAATQIVHLEQGRIIRAAVGAATLSKDQREIMLDPGDADPQIRGKKEVFPSSNLDTQRPQAIELVKEEARGSGFSSMAHIGRIMSAAGGVLFYLAFFSSALGWDLAFFLDRYWLEYWTDDHQLRRYHGQPFYLLGYAAILLLNAILDTAQWWLVRLGFVKRMPFVLHAKLVDSVLSSSLQTQQSLSIGRIINRFTADVNIVDSTVAAYVKDIFTFSTTAAMSMILVAWSSPAILIIFVLMTPLMIVLYKWFSALRMETKRIEMLAGTPVITIYNDVASSTSMIRAFGAQSAYTHRMLRFQDDVRRLEIVGYMSFIAFSQVLSMSSGLLFASIAIILVFQPWQSAGTVGVLLSLSTMGTQQVIGLLETLCNFGGDIVAVERIDEYCRLEPEKEDVTATVDDSWPPEGHVSIEGLTVRYQEDLPDVLHDISVDIKPGERVGIVGPTGHGKSTLALSIFRAVQARSGKICIDGVDISAISLQQLRSGLSMIPQEAMLTDGTLRNGELREVAFQSSYPDMVLNALRAVYLALDISQDKSDAELYDALRQAQLLGDDNEGRFANLDNEVGMGSSNFSAGECQLICLARALLKPRKVMVFDESTSSVNLDIDKRIREVIKTSFPGSTMLVIAHRLATIIDFDKVMVIEHGRLVEFDTPQALLKNTDSKFHKFAAASGEEEVF